MRGMAHPGETLRRWMKERDLSEGALSRLSKVPQPTIHRILTGESKSPRRATLEPIARVFGKGVEAMYAPNSQPGPVSLDQRAMEFALMVSSLTDEQMDVVMRTIEQFQKVP